MRLLATLKLSLFACALAALAPQAARADVAPGCSGRCDMSHHGSPRGRADAVAFAICGGGLLVVLARRARRI